MLRLRPYKPCDAQTIVGWIKTERIFYQWCAGCFQPYPLKAEDMNRYYDKERDNANIWGMTAFDETGPVGHFIMRYTKNDFSEIRFGFVIVDDEKRGKGYGKEMLALAIRYAFDILKASKIKLGVFANNVSAQCCYKACGFTETQSYKAKAYPCMGELWECAEMELVR